MARRVFFRERKTKHAGQAGQLFSMDLSGDKDLMHMLRTVAPKTARAALRAGIRAAARAYIIGARSKISKSQYFTLWKSINVRLHRIRKGGSSIRATMGPTAGKDQRWDAWYAHIVEKGADPHEIVPAVRRALALWGGDGRSGGAGGDVPIVSRVPRHPGVSANPFMGSAFRAGTEEAKKRAGAAMWKRFQKDLK